ncbi:MAG: DNA/RNA non-specific endonuclease [Verrucomicrobiota bacterium]
MAINLNQLEQAAARYQDHCAAADRADPETTRQEREFIAQRHRELFVPAPEQLAKLKSSPAALTAVGEPGAATPGTRALMALAGDLIPEVLERDNDLRPVRFLQLASLAARSVGRLRITDGPLTDEGDATGFLIAPGLLMTNWHVLKSKEFAAASSIIFDDEETLSGDLKETKTFRLRPDLLFVNDQTLDYAIVEVSPRTTSGAILSQFGFLRLFEQTGKLDPTQREAANIIQHPGGGSKKIALRDNYIQAVVPDGVDPAKQLNSLFYGTDTLKGSSGSPVCSDQWYVVALHRGGVPETRIINGQRVVIGRDGKPAHEGDSRDQIRYLTNEGTRVSRIYRSLRDKAVQNPDAREALQRISDVARDPRTGPVDLRTAPLTLPILPATELGGAEEIIRRKAPKFADAAGYRPTFLGTRFRIPLPHLTSEVTRELATLKNTTKTELKYDHYSLKINRERRTAFFAAANVDGALLWKTQGFGPLPPRPQWSYDPRMDESCQPDDAIFSQAMQRGHLFKREDAGWGRDKPAITRADEHSFTITNATPMIANFNNVEWGDLEDLVTRECELGHKVSYFAGPIFRSTDPFFNELRRDVPMAERQQGMRVPQSFWKIVAWVEGGTLKSAGFVLSQQDEIADHGPIAEEINFGTYRQKPLSEIEQATGLRFPELVRADTFQN